jgi:hypothetical protein
MALTTEDIQLIGSIVTSIVHDAIDDRVPGIVRKIVHEVVDPRFDRLEAIVADHGVRLDRLEKASP